MNSCPKGYTYSDSVSTCQPSCKSLSGPDKMCENTFTPIDGCICAEGTYTNDQGHCVLPAACPCYYKETIVAPDEVVHENGMEW